MPYDGVREVAGRLKIDTAILRAQAPEDIRRRIRWLPIGTAVDLAA